MPCILTHCSFASLQAGAVLLVRRFNRTPAEGEDFDQVAPIDSDVFQVVRTVEDGRRANRTVDLEVERLEYVDSRAAQTETSRPSYYIRGHRVGTLYTTAPDNYDAPVKSFRRYTEEVRFTDGLVQPSGRDLVRLAHGGKCLANCDNGWLPSRQRLVEMQGVGRVPALHAFRPLCPVRTGEWLIAKQLRLRKTMTDPSCEQEFELLYPNFMKGLQRRWRELGYANCSCRCCILPPAYGVPPTTHDEAVRLFEEWQDVQVMPEAEEHPVADAELARLPRLPFSEYEGGDTACTVCQCEFEEATEVLVLPCAHALCTDGCSNWLRHQNSCPVCRHRVPTGEPSPGWGEPDPAQWENPSGEVATAEEPSEDCGEPDPAQWENPSAEVATIEAPSVGRGESDDAQCEISSREATTAANPGVSWDEADDMQPGTPGEEAAAEEEPSPGRGEPDDAQVESSDEAAPAVEETVMPDLNGLHISPPEDGAQATTTVVYVAHPATGEIIEQATTTVVYVSHPVTGEIIELKVTLPAGVGGRVSVQVEFAVVETESAVDDGEEDDCGPVTRYRDGSMGSDDCELPIAPPDFYER